MKKLLFALMACTVLNGVSFAKDGSTTAEFQEAFQIANPDGLFRLVVARQEKVGVYGFYMLDLNGNPIEREVSKKKIIKDAGGDKDKISEDVLKLLAKSFKAKTKLPDGRLFEIAKEQLKDTPFTEVKYENKDGNLVISFGDTSIDATTGKPITKK
jgi:hypothetical protein